MDGLCPGARNAVAHRGDAGRAAVGLVRPGLVALVIRERQRR